MIEKNMEVTVPEDPSQATNAALEAGDSDGHHHQRVSATAGYPEPPPALHNASFEMQREIAGSRLEE